MFRDIIVGDHSLWLISEALDAVFDTFADGPLVNTAADSVGLMPNLVELVPVLKSRVRSGLIGQSENDYLLQCFNCQMLTIFPVNGNFQRTFKPKPLQKLMITVTVTQYDMKKLFE